MINTLQGLFCNQETVFEVCEKLLSSDNNLLQFRQDNLLMKIATLSRKSATRFFTSNGSELKQASLKLGTLRIGAKGGFCYYSVFII